MKVTEPFPHTVIDGYLSAETVSKINREWPYRGKWDKEDGKGSKKWSRPKLSKTAREVAEAIDVAMIEDATGITGLFPDTELFGAGLHCIPAGGYLKMHVDFNQHPKGWHRRANVLIYLNEVWRDEWGGHLHLGLENPKLIAPIGGRCVIFETNDESWHGHPHPLMCPEDVQRRSLALYYYTQDPPSEPAHTTIYKKAA
jgi:Rps23 Pro-64 3,4-dihydroxylase Tpa1-like proline 4-hydroxylase